ncbi:MAG: RNA methyltransferase [Urechidicola sp.]
MLSKNQIKLITSLQQKKYRSKHDLFIVEGVKGVNEFLKSEFKLDIIFCTDTFSHEISSDKVQLVSDNELKKISNLKNPNQVLALFFIPEGRGLDFNKSTLVLDGVNDPGNLGTIIRLCDWFGIEQLLCSPTTVDCYNSKVVQSTMGSLKRVSIEYSELKPFLNTSTLPIYASIMNGKNIYENPIEKDAIIVMGNEANGISQEILDIITYSVTIPRFGKSQETESLNVATATAILLSEFRRN